MERQEGASQVYETTGLQTLALVQSAFRRMLGKILANRRVS